MDECSLSIVTETRWWKFNTWNCEAELSRVPPPAPRSLSACECDQSGANLNPWNPSAHDTDCRGSPQTDERADYLTVRMCPHAQPAWLPLSRRLPLCRSVIVRKSGRKKKQKLPESHLSVTCERRADEPSCRDEGKVANDEGCAFIGDVLPVACRQRKNTAERSTHRWHQWTTVTVRFGKFWIFMMMSYWVAIGARAANKLSPPCLKGNALPILKTLPCFLEATGKRWENHGYLRGSPPPSWNLLKSPPLPIWSTA